jgi:DnaJ-domain-containing protein 1
MLRCSKCLSFAKVEIDQEGHLYIEKATVHESNTVPDTVEGCLSKLGVHANATSQEIKQAYRKRMQEYHPDKVAHLGPKLRELAAVEAQVLNSIYELLRASGRLDGSFRS